MATPVTPIASTTASQFADSPNVDYMLPELAAMLPKYELIRDCLAGQEAVKKRRTVYLPKPNPDDRSPANDARYDSYIARAVFYGVTANTTKGLVGQVFASDPVSEFPKEMDVMWYDVNGANVSMEQQAKRALTNVLAFGRCGLLTDFPAAKEGGGAWTREEILEGTARPVIQFYHAEDIINWRHRIIGAKLVLSMVVLNESYTIRDDGFEIKKGTEKRVLRLDDDGLYEIERWRRRDDAEDGEWYKVDEVIRPVDGNGNRLTYIPFTFVGSENNDASVDKPPMYDLACLNIAHYRNSADYEDSVYMVGQPTPYFAGLTKTWVDEVLKGEIQLGSRAAVPLPEGASAGLIQASENTMVKEAMDKKEQQMIALGAQLVEEKRVARTLGEAKMETAIVASVLTSCARNVSQAMLQCIKWACDFYGYDDATKESCVYQLSTDFAIQKMSSDERRQLLAEWQAGLVSFSEARSQLRQNGVATLDDEEAKDEIEEERKNDMDLNASLGFNLDGAIPKKGEDDEDGGDDENKGGE